MFKNSFFKNENYYYKWVGISEAISLLSTYSSLMMKYLKVFNYSLKLNESFTLFKSSCNFKDTTNEEINGETISPSQNNNSEKNRKFNEWLAGIIDGDGCFQLSKKGYASLEIVMQLRDKHCLYQIKENYGGSVKLHGGDNYLRYRLHHKAGLLNLINGVNGLIRNPVRILQLGKICEKYEIELKDSQTLTYYSAWFSGFFDTDGSIYLNDTSGQVFITAVQKNRFMLDALVELYGGQIYPMVKQGAFKWTCFKKKEILSLVNDYFKVNSCRSEKLTRLSMVNKFYELRQLHAHKATPNSDLGKVWKNYLVKWNSLITK